MKTKIEIQYKRKKLKKNNTKKISKLKQKKKMQKTINENQRKNSIY